MSRRSGLGNLNQTPRGDVVDIAVEVVGQLRSIGLQRLLDPRAVDTDRLRHTITEHWRRALSPAEA